MSEYRFTVEAEQENERLDKYLSSLLAECSRNYIQKLIKEGAVTVNEKPVKASSLLHVEDEVAISVPEPVLPESCRRIFHLILFMKMTIFSL